MIKNLFTSILLMMSVFLTVLSQDNNSTSQQKTIDTLFFQPDPRYIHYVSDTPAQFPGGDSSLFAYVKKHLKYPKSLVKDSIKGEIVIRFCIDENGVADNVGFLRSLHPELERRCIEMVRDMPKWTPGTMVKSSKKGLYWGSAKSWYMLPIFFTPGNDYPDKKLVIHP